MRGVSFAPLIFPINIRLMKTSEASDDRTEAITRSTGRVPELDGEFQVTEIGSIFGPYELQELIGEGGMGVVYRATQVTPLRREVAIKLIKPGLDTRQIIQRFEAERQALAMMDHPNIAHVLDAGSTAAGRPYFVMELVDGQPITTFCDQHSLSLTERLNLFCELCEAVQHAHQKGIIHRDLKPSNVMIVVRDRKPLVRVIDFGLAKALEQKLTDQTFWTNYQNIIGTPLYMSPEQAEPLGLSVDTRSDVYSLGVMLYELLVGRTPFDADQMRRATSETVRAILRDREPRRPSQRFTSLSLDPDGATIQEDIAKQRRLDPRGLLAMVRGDVDWIVMKALDRDRDRRYDSPRALRDDINRFLRHDPVLASPPSHLYRTRRFLRKYRVPILGATLVASLLLLATFVSVLFAREAIRLRAVAEVRTRASLEIAYSSDMRLASFAMERGDSDQVVDLLKQWAPSASQNDEALADLRGIEWHLLWQMAMPSCELFPNNVSCGYCIRMSPDASTLAVCGTQGDIVFFDPESHQVLQRIVTGQGELNGIAFSPDGRRIASAGDDGNIKIWDLATSELRLTVAAQQRHAFQVEFTLDGERFISAGEDTSFHLWDASSGDRIGVFEGHSKSVQAIAMSPCGRYVASVSDDRTARVWDVETQNELGPALTLSGIGSAVRFSPDSKLLAFADLDGRASVIAVDRLKESDAPIYVAAHSDGVQSLDFSADNQWLVTGDRGGVVRLWNPSLSSTTSGIDDSPERSWKAHHHRIYSLVSHPTSGSLFTVCAGGNIREWRVPEPSYAGPIRLAESSIHTITLLPGSAQAIGVTGLGRVESIDIDQRTTLKRVPVPEVQWRSCEAISDSVIVLASIENNQICLYDLKQQRVLAQQRFAAEILNECDLSVSPNGQWIALSCQTQGKPGLLLDAKTLEHVADIPTDYSYGLEWRPGSDELAIISHHQIHWWNARTQRMIRTLGSGRSPYKALAFSHDGMTLVAAASNRAIHAWDMQTCKESVIGRSAHSDPSSLAFSPDGQTLFAVDMRAGSILAWRTSSWRFIGPTLRMLVSPMYIQFTPDGKKIAVVARHALLRDESPNLQRDVYFVDLAAPTDLSRDDSQVSDSIHSTGAILSSPSQSPP